MPQARSLADAAGGNKYQSENGMREASEDHFVANKTQLLCVNCNEAGKLSRTNVGQKRRYKCTYCNKTYSTYQYLCVFSGMPEIEVIRRFGQPGSRQSQRLTPLSPLQRPPTP